MLRHSKTRKLESWSTVEFLKFHVQVQDQVAAVFNSLSQEPSSWGFWAGHQPRFRVLEVSRYFAKEISPLNPALSLLVRRSVKEKAEYFSRHFINTSMNPKARQLGA